jgi:small subunit ribosomal protein S21e
VALPLSLSGSHLVSLVLINPLHLFPLSSLLSCYVSCLSSWTNRILAANDHGCVQLNVANIDPITGLYTKSSTTFALCGYIRAQAEGDTALLELIKKNDSSSTE